MNNKMIFGALAAVVAVTAGLYLLGKSTGKRRSREWSFENILPRVRQIVAPVAELVPAFSHNGKRKS